MSLILCGTQFVNTDEPCLSVVEMHLVHRPDSKGLHRYMIITVVRNDKEEQFWMDLGPATQFKAPQVRIVAGGRDPAGKLWSEHNVGEAVEMANQIREGHIQQPEPPPTTDLVKAFHDQRDLRRKWKKKQSTFGPGAALQRS